MRTLITTSLFLIFFSSCELIVSKIESFRSDNKEINNQSVEEEEKENSNSTVKNGVKNFYHKNGKIKSIVTYKDNKKVGVSHTFYKTGEKQYDIPYLEGKKHGKVIWYYQSGKVYRETEYKLGKKDGFQKKYWESGKLKSEAFYKENMLSIGLKEISNTNKVKSEPKIIVDKIDNVATTGEYVLRFKLSNGKKKVSFYFGELVEGKYFPVDGRGLYELQTKNGIAEYKFKIEKGTQLIKDIQLIAIESTSYQNERIISLKIPISKRNPL